VRVISLLPSATEIVAALGGGAALVGISHECDYPAEVQHLPRVTTTPIDITAPGCVINADVERLSRAGNGVIAIDERQLRELAPDLILTQDLCQVCAVGEGQVHRLAVRLSPAPQVLSLAARDLGGIWHDIARVGEALGLKTEAHRLLRHLRGRLQELDRLNTAERPRVLCVEWLDPLFLAGHWVPELVEAAGGHDVSAEPGSHSRRADWDEVSRLEPDCILIMLCGFGVERSRAELEALADADAIELMSRVPTWIIDANAYTSRPGPRVVAGAALLQSALRRHRRPGLLQWQPSRSMLAT
jgi:iron complex transport system substrate-binding protein